MFFCRFHPLGSGTKKSTYMGRKGPRAKTKTVLKPVKHWEKHGSMPKSEFLTFLNKNHPTIVHQSQENIFSRDIISLLNAAIVLFLSFFVRFFCVLFSMLKLSNIYFPKNNCSPNNLTSTRLSFKHNLYILHI